MSRFTSISPYRQWDVRFGTRPHGIDTTVRTYQLTPDQLERLRNGEKLDDILKGASEVVKQKLDLTVEEYVGMKLKGMNDAEIAEAKGLTDKQLYSWKYVRRSKIAQAERDMQVKMVEKEAESAQQEVTATVEAESETQEPTVTEETQPDVAEDDNGIEWLKREVIHAHKLLTEKEQECERLKQEAEHWKELFETAMADKERLHKENLLLENQVQRLKEVNDELKARNERYFASLTRLEQEVKGLRLYALQKLHTDVYGA
ncbi:chromosome segregation ATPase [Anoxybacillus voinovskiensis]|uniref:Chromosome segregation ATPase n=1 Tax=Anoxybacteroides voinovskiense TaxID=230470 RepID=A0A840DR12_9BACL|nr:hypothetical protein [Anoxybacillus voinovskiensis]MBB4074083.1 chromosome segregation ATPase [Anoxybacillus voinovskiensis]GGJ68473.1 hypothetical protein GCM10008982_17350 [Anoxybacillus voinovskiensis]